MLDFRQSLSEIIHLSQNKAHVVVYFEVQIKFIRNDVVCKLFLTLFVSRLHHM